MSTKVDKTMRGIKVEEEEYIDWDPDEFIEDDKFSVENSNKPMTCKSFVNNIIFGEEESFVLEDDEDVLKDERKALRKYEADIEKWEEGSIQAGIALYNIRRYRLYRAEHLTFKDYLREKWDISRARGNQIATAGTVYLKIRDIIKNPPPKYIAPLLALSKLYPEHAAIAYDYAYKECGKAPTAKAITKAIEELKAKQECDYLNEKEEETEEDKNVEDEVDNEEEEGKVKKRGRKSVFVMQAEKYVAGLEGVIALIDKHRLSTKKSVLKDEAVMVRQLLEGVMRKFDEMVNVLSHDAISPE